MQQQYQQQKYSKFSGQMQHQQSFINDDTANQSFLAGGKSELLVSSEKGIVYANQSDVCGGNMQQYQQELNSSKSHQLSQITEDREPYENLATLDHCVIARQNSNQQLDDLPLSFSNPANKLYPSQLESSTQKIDRIVLSTIVDQSNRSQSRPIQYSNQTMSNIKKKEKGLSINFLAIFKTRMLWFFRNFTYSGKTKALTTCSRIAINDLSDFHPSKKKIEIQNRNIQQYLIQRCMKYLKGVEKLAVALKLNRLPLFNPENPYRIVFNSILMSYNCFYLLLVSLEVFFAADFYYQSTFHDIAITSWIIEMMINMNTSNYHSGQFINDRKKIIQIYLNEYFLFEMIPLLFENLSSENVWIEYSFKIPLLLKIKGITNIYERIEFFILHSLKRRYLLEIFKLIFKLFLLTHIMACSYNVFSIFEANVLNISETWKVLNPDKEWYASYAQSQVWAFTTMCNTTSQLIMTTQEYLFTSFWMLISSIAFAYLINKIGNILSELHSQEDSYREDINILNQFMKRKQINLGLQRMLNLEIKQYYKQESLKKEIDVKGALSRLSKPMYKELMQEAYKKVLNTLPYFKKYVSEHNQYKIYEIMEEIGYSSHQVIQENEQESDSAIYYVLKGQFVLNQSHFSQESKQEQKTNEIFMRKKSIYMTALPTSQQKSPYSAIKVVREGECFGVYEFLTGQKRKYVAESQNVSVVIRISLSKFIEIIKNDELDYQKYKETKDKLTYNTNISFLEVPCYSCGQCDHYFLDCSKTHFIKTNPFLIPKYNFSEIQERDYNISRRPRRPKKIFKKFAEEEYYSESSQNDKGEDYYSFLDSERDVEKYENRVQRHSNYSVHNGSLPASPLIEVNEDYQEEPVIIISSASLNKQYPNMPNSSSFNHNLNNKNANNNEMVDDKNSMGGDSLKNLKQVRKSSNKQSNSSFRISTSNSILSSQRKRHSVDDINPKVLKNCFVPIEEISESEKENEQSFPKESSNNIQSFLNSASNTNFQFGNRKQSRNSFLGLQQFQLNQSGKFTYGDQTFRRMVIEWKDSMDYWRFDKMQNMKFFFTDYNCPLVLRRVAKYKNKQKPKSKTDRILNQQSSCFKKFQSLQKNKTTTPMSYQYFQTKITKVED